MLYVFTVNMKFNSVP